MIRVCHTWICKILCGPWLHLCHGDTIQQLLNAHVYIQTQDNKLVYTITHNIECQRSVACTRNSVEIQTIKTFWNNKYWSYSSINYLNLWMRKFSKLTRVSAHLLKAYGDSTAVKDLSFFGGGLPPDITTYK